MRQGARKPNQTALKVAALIVAAGAVSAEILASRAQRLRSAHAATTALEEARSIDRTIEQARFDIAQLSSPQRVRAMLQQQQREMEPLLASTRAGSSTDTHADPRSAP